MKLSDVAEKFILHWGEMGARWGINRTVAQIHALLFLSEKPLTAEQIATTLDVARSNVSTSLKELQNWGIVKVVHVLGDRRDHFESMKDVWEMFRVILDERKKRETDPTLQILRDCVTQAKQSEDAYTRQRLLDMLSFFEQMTEWYESTRRMTTPSVLKIVKLGDKVARMMGVVS
jgi:DNA-binding transcriptional regulator GbsR (MarR family)